VSDVVGTRCAATAPAHRAAILTDANAPISEIDSYNRLQSSRAPAGPLGR
jgi:hypothetical protein